VGGLLIDGKGSGHGALATGESKLSALEVYDEERLTTTAVSSPSFFRSTHSFTLLNSSFSSFFPLLAEPGARDVHIGSPEITLCLSSVFTFCSDFPPSCVRHATHPP